MVGALEFNSDLFDDQTIQRLIGYYQKVLRILLEKPETQLTTIELPDNAEKHCCSTGEAAQQPIVRSNPSIT
ncbi:hypothetical protein HAALTHF_51200n [Vreelandella aquamarina]|nr:hypothetical protein HAALTHF_51200n [Halomonas axialensis]